MNHLINLESFSVRNEKDLEFEIKKSKDLHKADLIAKNQDNKNRLMKDSID